MKNSIRLLTFFVLGVLGGWLELLPDALLSRAWSLGALSGLVFLVGVGIGSDAKAWKVVRKLRFKVLLVPVSVVLGTFAGVSVCSLVLPGMSLGETLAVGAGLGYYSLSSVLIGKMGLTALSVVALLSNICRELLTLVLTPILARYCGKLSPIASAGATAMDTTLPVITEFSGTDYAMIAVASGTVLTVLVPVLVKIIVVGLL